MQSNKQQHFPQKPPGPPLTGQGGHNDTPFSSLFGGPFQNVNFQPSETCPRNFIIFDRTDNRSQIMYHPGVGLNINSSPWLVQDNLVTNEVLFRKPEITSSIIKENSDDIEALLNFEGGEYEGEEEEEEVSTGRSCNYGSDSAEDSCSSKPRKRSKLGTSSSSHKPSTGSGRSREGCGERKREKIREKVKELRGIIPSTSNRKMKSVDVVDEAVRYLKSLKVEVQYKFGVGNLNK